MSELREALGCYACEQPDCPMPLGERGISRAPGEQLCCVHYTGNINRSHAALLSTLRSPACCICPEADALL